MAELACESILVRSFWDRDDGEVVESEKMNLEMLVQIVQTEAAAALGLEIETVLPESCLVRDLGAESIDFIDLTFRLEKAVGHPLEEATLFRAGGNGDRTIQQVAERIQNCLSL
jgi:acyl carrier protein